jgi:hypothetical protein
MRGWKVRPGRRSGQARVLWLQAPTRLWSDAVLVAAAAEITTFSEVIVVYKFLGDLMFYVTGSQDENELILYQVLQGFYESISLLLRCAAKRSQLLGLPCRLVGLQRC